jgi:hypothetical protein
MKIKHSSEQDLEDDFMRKATSMMDNLPPQFSFMQLTLQSSLQPLFGIIKRYGLIPGLEFKAAMEIAENKVCRFFFDGEDSAEGCSFTNFVKTTNMNATIMCMSRGFQYVTQTEILTR